MFSDLDMEKWQLGSYYKRLVLKKMPKFNLLRSYGQLWTSHEVEAKTEDEAIQKIENNPYRNTSKKL